jgi:hypothetical protein
MSQKAAMHRIRCMRRIMPDCLTIPRFGGESSVQNGHRAEKLMKSLRALLVLGALGFLTRSATVHGQCVEFTNPEESFARAAAVFVGIVVAQEPTGLRGNHVIEAIATFRLERSWKGIRDREVRVGSDRALEIGKKYVVFAGGNPRNRSLTTNFACRWVEVIDTAKVKLDWLSTRPSELVD